MAVIDDVLSGYTEAETLEDAERALDKLATDGTRLPSPIGDFYDDLAEIAAEDGDFVLAARVQRKAIDHGCTYLDLAREMLGWYLLKSGDVAAGEASFAEARRNQPEDASVVVTLGAARADAGLHDAALEAYDEAVALAMRHGPPDMLEHARVERRG